MAEVNLYHGVYYGLGQFIPPRVKLYPHDISTLTFSEHVANLTRSSYFHLRRLRAIRRISLLSCLYLNCTCLRLLSHRLLQFPSDWSSKGSSFSYSVCSKRCC